MKLVSQVANTRQSESEHSRTPHPEAALASVQSGIRRTSSESLLGGFAEMQITHNGSIYRLRTTALGKLILTK
ncbi:MAG: hemin uptake protein HemP [Betaproteobacteria bacterium]|nr:MAG: hemin uptake protein HemP [Betaproteobacteria bacterium]